MDSNINNNVGLFPFWKKNQRQLYSMISATLLMMCFGLHLNSTLYPLVEYGPNRHDIKQKAFRTLSFVGTALGAAVACILLEKLKKTVHYSICGIIFLITGTIWLFQTDDRILKNLETFNNLGIAISFFQGLSFGVCLLTAIVHAGEISNKCFRGVLVGIIQLALDIGLILPFLINIILNDYFRKDFDYNGLNELQVQGSLMIITSIISFVTTFFLVIESTEFLIQSGNEVEAKKNLMKLRREQMETVEIIHHMEEIKQTLRNENSKNVGIFESLIPTLKIFFLRLPFILGTGIQINFFMRSFLLRSGFFIIFVLIRIIGDLIVILCCERIGRKRILIISLSLAGLFVIIFGTVFVMEYDKMKLSFFYIFFEIPSNLTFIFSGLSLLFQAALGFGSPIPYIYMSELFAFKNKTSSNAFIIISESTVFIATVLAVGLGEQKDVYIYFYVTGIVQLLAALFVWKFIPETAGKSLKECNELMEKYN